MADNDSKSVLHELHDTLFGKTWPMWIGGLVLAALAAVLFVIYYPWGANGGYVNLGQNVYRALGLSELGNTGVPVSEHGVALLNLMILMGAFVGALMSREFAIRIPPVGELFKGLIGGALMGIGANVGIGCTTGGFLSGVSSLSGGSLMLTLGFLIGTFTALKYLLWEMEAMPGISMGKTITLLSGNKKGGIWQVILGWIVLIAGFILVYHYTGMDGGFSGKFRVLGWIILLGILLGIVLQRSRFCVVRALREPFMTGETEAPVAISAYILFSVIAYAGFKYFGIGGGLRAVEMRAIYPNFWLLGPLGGIIFGWGMTIAGGCAVGTIWRAGEGHVKLWLSFIGFMLMAPVARLYIRPWFESWIPFQMRYKMFLPDYFGYGGAVAIVLGILLLWYLFVKWNERTGKFTSL